MQKIVIEIISHLLPPECKTSVNPDTKLAALPFNSIKFIQMVVALENLFHIEFDEDKLSLPAFSAVADIIEYVGIKAGVGSAKPSFDGVLYDR